MKKLLSVIVFVAVILIAFGCKQKEKTENKYSIAVIPKGTTHVFWKSIHAGAVKAERELKDAGIDVEIIWKGPLKEDDRESQIRVVEDFVTRGVSGIVLAPLDEMALRVPVKNAVGYGIPVVIIDDFRRKRESNYVTVSGRFRQYDEAGTGISGCFRKIPGNRGCQLEPVRRSHYGKRL
jgi:ABC-type sugar transport system substrate-binding protein